MGRQSYFGFWRGLTLPTKFFLAGTLVIVLAALTVGNWVSSRIEASVVTNSGVSAALFMESVIAPLSQELETNENLSAPAKQALQEIFAGTALGERIVSYKIWMPDGRVVYASDASLSGMRFEVSDELRAASSGEVAAEFGELEDEESLGEAALGLPLLEVYSPIRQAWTGEVIAVAEFYERADKLASDIADARRTSWLVVSGSFLASGLLLFGIVQAGGRTIRQQREALENQLSESRRISMQNATLRSRAVSASARATAQTERAIRRVGFDLHDGPGQYLALASLRLDAALRSENRSEEDVQQVRESLDKALKELRLISRGLSLPDLDQIEIDELARRAVRDHEAQSGLIVDLAIAEDLGDAALDYAGKLCLYRFLQETLSNVSRHAGVDHASVAIKPTAEGVSVVVADAGQGFDPSGAMKLRNDGGQGLLGLTDRAESIGGRLTIDTAQGTRITLVLPTEGKLP